MSRAEEYLAIPVDYCRWLGGLRWCWSGEAIEYASDAPEIGITFAMGGEIALFLQGYVTTGRPIAFGGVLHLLHLLGLGVRNPNLGARRRAERLEGLFRELKRPFRNAGALCGHLCREVPAVPDPPEVADLCLVLTRPGPEPTGPGRSARAGLVPPLDPATFEDRVLRALDRLTQEELRHWLRFGRGPVGEAGAEAMRAVPRSLSGRVAALAARPRLAGVGPLVAHLAGSLALPPRRLAPAELSTGGYSDVATRGLPEQILPAQLALDGEEFVRRFVQQELLYYRREEPRTRASEEVVVVLDQGIRTWGEVRLVLSAAALALARQAERKGRPFLLTTTGREGALVDPLRITERELGELLEASDLTADPAAALGRVLERPGGAGVRDLIVLTHARSLVEPAVKAAAGRGQPGTRLFAVTVDGEGQVEFSELQHGAAVVRSRCRIDPARTRRVEPGPRREPARDPRTWTGNVETPGWPFRLGALSPISSGLVDFDESGEWLLFAGQQGLLHAWRVEGGRMEMLPRALVDGRAVHTIGVVLGVAGGFVVVGRGGGSWALIHYDLVRTRCTVHPLRLRSVSRKDVSYHRHLHCVVARNGPIPSSAVDLDAEPEHACYSPRHGTLPASARAAQAFEDAWDSARLPEADPADGGPGAASSALFRLDPDTGVIELRDRAGAWGTITPQRDGRPVLVGGQVRLVRSGGDIVAAAIAQPDSTCLYLLSRASLTVMGVWPLRAQDSDFTLSRDGRRFARKIGERHLEVRAIPGGPTPLLFTPKAMANPELAVELRESSLVIRNDRCRHWVRWDRDRLDVCLGVPGRADPDAPGLGLEAVRAASILDETGRFVASCTRSGLTAKVDFIGQVCLFDGSSSLICMFYVFGDKIAAWMPDGTCLGPEPLIGGSASPGAEERIAHALRSAQSQDAAEAAR